MKSFASFLAESKSEKEKEKDDKEAAGASTPAVKKDGKEEVDTDPEIYDGDAPRPVAQ